MFEDTALKALISIKLFIIGALPPRFMHPTKCPRYFYVHCNVSRESGQI
jgi:hypothetical protein